MVHSVARRRLSSRATTNLIKQWATERHAAPATGEATGSGPATFKVNDGGAGIRFNFPGVGAFRPIGWEEWFENFEHHACAFVYDNDSSRPLSSRYRMSKQKTGKICCRNGK